MPGIAGLNAGLGFIRKKGVKKILEHENKLVERAASGLERLGAVKVYKSEFGFGQTGVLSFVVGKIPCETVGQELGRRGIAVRAGLHCAPLAHRTAETAATGTVRMSVSAFNTMRDIVTFLGAVEDIIISVRQ
jgi:selenocysteine lyase/cysteine desulfurase